MCSKRCVGANCEFGTFRVRFSARTRHVIIGVKPLLSTVDRVSLMGRGSSVVGATLQNLAKFVYPTSPRLSYDTLYTISLFCIVPMPGD